MSPTARKGTVALQSPSSCHIPVLTPCPHSTLPLLPPCALSSGNNLLTWSLRCPGQWPWPLSPLLSPRARQRPELPCSKGSYLAVLCQQLDVAVIDLLHLVQLAAAHLPLDDVPVVDLGAQLPGQDRQGLPLWRQIIEDLRKEKAKRVLGRRNRETQQRDRARVKAAVQGAQEDADFHEAEEEKTTRTEQDFSGCCAQRAHSLHLVS